MRFCPGGGTGGRRGSSEIIPHSKGTCTYDVCSEGEGGGWLNSDQRKGGCVDLILTREREGVKNHANLANVICKSPLLATNLDDG